MPPAQRSRYAASSVTHFEADHAQYCPLLCDMASTGRAPSPGWSSLSASELLTSAICPRLTAVASETCSSCYIQPVEYYLKCWRCLQGDLLLIAAGAPAVVHKTLDRVRQYIAASLGEVDSSQHNLSWVTGEPLHIGCCSRTAWMCCLPAAQRQRDGHVAITLPCVSG